LFFKSFLLMKLREGSAGEEVVDRSELFMCAIVTVQHLK
jgi:hypothetical protein